MNRKQQRTLERIFAAPTPANIDWRDIEALLRALGATIEEGRGSRLVVRLENRRAVFHRPHPDPSTRRGTVRAVRDLLLALGIEP